MKEKFAWWVTARSIYKTLHPSPGEGPRAPAPRCPAPTAHSGRRPRPTCPIRAGLRGGRRHLWHTASRDTVP